MENIVGLASSPKPDPNRKVHSATFSISSKLPLASSHWVFSSAEGLGRWLGEIEKFDFRTGGKIRYQSEGHEYGATYTAIRIPKQVVLVTESLGEAKFDIKDHSSGFDLNIYIQKALLPDEVSSWETAVAKTFAKIEELLG